MTWATEGRLNEKAAYWAISDYGGSGEKRVSAAVEIDCHWEQFESEIRGPDGAPIATSDQVLVDREIAVGSLMRLGTTASVPSPADNLREVVGYESILNSEGTDYQRTAILARYKGGLPTIV